MSGRNYFVAISINAIFEGEYKELLNLNQKEKYFKTLSADLKYKDKIIKLQIIIDMPFTNISSENVIKYVSDKFSEFCSKEIYYEEPLNNSYYFWVKFEVISAKDYFRMRDNDKYRCFPAVFMYSDDEEKQGKTYAGRKIENEDDLKNVQQDKDYEIIGLTNDKNDTVNISYLKDDFKNMTVRDTRSICNYFFDYGQYKK